MAKPITPAEVVELKSQVIPDGVIESFNLLITNHFDGRQAVVKLQDAIHSICVRMGMVSRQELPSWYLDVEPLFRQAGWKVKYEQPGYCESGEAFYTFSK